MSKEAEDLAECLASLSDMANTGMDISELLLHGELPTTLYYSVTVAVTKETCPLFNRRFIKPHNL